jgi:group I intron endonuclease
MKYIVYQTTNLVNGKIYVGVHHTENPNVFDGYLGSGKILLKAVKKCGYDSFNRETLSVHDKPEDAYDEERKIVDKVFTERSDTYNLVNGGDGFVGGEDHPYYGKKFPDSHRKNMSDAASGENNGFYERKHSKEAKEKWSNDRKGENHPQYGTHHSEETCVKIGKAKRMSCEMLTQRRLDVANIDQVLDWRRSLAKKWGVALSTANSFILKDAPDLVKRDLEKIKIQRCLDIQKSNQKFGWQACLAKKWGVNPNTVCVFIQRHASDLVEALQ